MVGKNIRAFTHREALREIHLRDESALEVCRMRVGVAGEGKLVPPAQE